MHDIDERILGYTWRNYVLKYHVARTGASHRSQDHGGDLLNSLRVTLRGFSPRVNPTMPLDNPKRKFNETKIRAFWWFFAIVKCN